MKPITTCIFIILYVSISPEVNCQNNVDDNSGQVQFDIDVDKKTYSYSFKTPDSITKEESGHFEPNPPGEDALVVEGSYSYVGTDGLTYLVTYTADKNGFHPNVEFPETQAAGAGGVGGGGVGYSAPVGAPGLPAAGQPGKAIDTALLCSLAGSGCK